MVSGAFDFAPPRLAIPQGVAYSADRTDKDCAMRRLDDILEQLRAMQPELCRRYPIRSMGVFGSFVRGEQREDSDLDVLVEFGDEVGLFEYAGLQIELSDMLGMKVDVANRAALKPRIGQRILAEVRML